MQNPYADYTNPYAEHPSLFVEVILAERYDEGRTTARRHAGMRTPVTGKPAMMSAGSADTVSRAWLATWLDESDKYPPKPELVEEAIMLAVYWQGYRDEAEAIEARR